MPLSLLTKKHHRLSGAVQNEDVVFPGVDRSQWTVLLLRPECVGGLSAGQCSLFSAPATLQTIEW